MADELPFRRQAEDAGTRRVIPTLVCRKPARHATRSGVYLACPYTSPSVLAAMMTVPWDVKLREEKHLVRAALRQLGVPETFVARPKLSLGFPARFWAPKRALFQPIVDMATRVYDAGVLESLQREEGGASMVLWCLLNQFLWVQLFEVGRSGSRICPGRSSISPYCRQISLTGELTQAVKRPRLLFLAYPFPPRAAIASVRTGNIARYLARLGWGGDGSDRRSLLYC